MNPNPDSNAPAADADWLDDLLRADGASDGVASITDAGFSLRVMASLPAPLPASAPKWRRPVVAALWAAVAVGVGFAIPGIAVDILREGFRLAASHSPSIGEVAAGVAMLTVATWSATAYALSSD